MKITRRVVCSHTLLALALVAASCGGDDTQVDGSLADSGADALPRTGDSQAGGGAPEVEWVYGYGGLDTEEHPHAGAQLADGGFVMVGESSGESGSRIFIVRTDERGGEVFGRAYGENQFNLGNFVVEDARGELLVAGSWDAGRTSTDEDRVLLRLSSTGEVLARQVYPSAGRDAMEGIHLNADGSMIGVGYVGADIAERNTFIVDSGGGVVMGLNADLSAAWEKSLPASFFHPFRVLPRASGTGYAVFGACRRPTDEPSFCMSFIDGEGNSSEPILYGDGTSNPFDFDATPDGGYIMTGHRMTCAEGCWDGWMLKVDADGVVIWELTFGEPNGGTPEQMYEECYGVRAVASGGYVTGCGTGVEPGNEVSASDPLNIWRAYVVRVSELGVILWQASYGSPESNNAAEFILATGDGGFAVIADSDQYSEGAANFALFKLGPDPR